MVSRITIILIRGQFVTLAHARSQDVLSKMQMLVLWNIRIRYVQHNNIFVIMIRCDV